MPSQSLLQILGSKGNKETRYAPIFTDRFFVGYWSNRNPLRSPLSTFYADGWHLGGTDALISGTNIELSPRLTLCRRPGNVAYSTATFTTPPLTFYPFRLFGATSPSIDVIVDTLGNIYNLTTTSSTSIFSKAANAGQSNFRGIGQTLYFGDGAEVMAWQNGTIRNWGISISPFTAATGPNTAGTGASGAVNPWTNPSDITGTSGYATITLSNSGGIFGPTVSGTLLATNFSFSLGLTEIVSGITITIAGFATVNSGTGTIFRWFHAQLLRNGSPVGNIISVAAPGVSTTLTFGGSSNTWGLTLSGNDINQSTWGVQITAVLYGNANFTFNAQNAQATINGVIAPAVTPTGSGSLSLTTGWSYAAAYGNSSSGQVSSATPVSVTTGPQTSKSYIGVGLIASTDPQVNQIWLFRTTDGGSSWLNLPSSPYPNTTQTIQDTNPDTTLNILQQAPLNFVNNPPPTQALDPIYYLNLVWVHVGNTVYCSRTPSAIVGVTQESFPPGNAFPFPETVIRKIPFSSGLLVFTTSNIYIILGNNTLTSPLYPAPFEAGYGIQSWNAVWNDGSVIYFFTSNHRMMELNPSSGLSDIGFPIADQLATLNPANVYVTYNSSTSNDSALYVGDGSTGWYRCNPNQVPDGAITGPVWNPKATIVGGLQALVGMETSPGVHQLMMGGSGASEPVLVRDSTYTTFTDNGTAYEANYTIGSIVLAQPGQVAICRFVTADFIRTGTSPTVSVLLGEVSGTFQSISGYVWQDPPKLPASTSLFNNRYYFKQSIGGAVPPPVLCRHLQIKVDYGMDSVQNEILSMTINAAIVQEK